MKDEAQPWFPTGAMAGAWARARLQPVLDAWSAHWFAARTFQVGRLSERSGPTGADDGSRGGRSCAVRCLPAAALRLAESALDLRHDSEFTNRDHRLLEQIAEVLIDDLRVRLEHEFGEDSASSGGGWLEASVAEGAGPDALLLALPTQALARAFRKAAGPPANPSALPRLRASLADLSVTIEATVGNLAVSMPDLAALAPGDVLVFSTRVDDPIEVSLVGSPQAFARARFADQDGELALVFQPVS